ncbi:MAG: ArsR/SmtB family transcription factor [Desulfovibrio sp.]
MCANDVCKEVCVHDERVERVKAAAPDDESIDNASQLFKLLGDKTRMRILHALSVTELCVCDLASLLDVSISAVSHQLRLLRTARLVKFRKEGKNAFYSLHDQHIVTLLKAGVEHVQE